MTTKRPPAKAPYPVQGCTRNCCQANCHHSARLDRDSNCFCCWPRRTKFQTYWAESVSAKTTAPADPNIAVSRKRLDKNSNTTVPNRKPARAERACEKINV